MTKDNNKFWAKFYKIRYYPSITEKQTKTEICFYKKFLPKTKYKKILNFICGFGRHAIGMANFNYHYVEGFDIDKGSVKQGQKRSAR